MAAVDVAFTEAAVGAGVSTVFFIATAYNIKRRKIENFIINYSPSNGRFY